MLDTGMRVERSCQEASIRISKHPITYRLLLLLVLLQCTGMDTFHLPHTRGAASVRCACVRNVEPPFPHPFYDDQPLQKTYSDYEWDPDYPGTLKPGTRKEKYDLDEVMLTLPPLRTPLCPWCWGPGD